MARIDFPQWRLPLASALAAAAAALLFVACSDDGDSDAEDPTEASTETAEGTDPTDATTDGTTEQADVASGFGCGLELGQPCFFDEQCNSGICLVSEFSPFGMCTVRCVDPPSMCTTVDGESIPGAWCVEMPDDQFEVFVAEDNQPFCVRNCDTLDDCKAIDPAYEVCENPLFRGSPLYGGVDLIRTVCQAPSASGKIPVDPFTCADWDTANPGFNNEKNQCSEYCQFLSDCQYYEPTHNLTCCEWYCFLELVPNNQVNGAYEDILVNHTNWFKANQDTAETCTSDDQFGAPPIPDLLQPASPAGSCE